MSNKNQNDKGWKAGLDELAAVPGELPFDSNASWEKLELRLSGQRNRHRRMMYWLVAAAVTGFTVVSVLQVEQPTGKVVGNAVVKSRTNMNKPTEKALVENEDISVVTKQTSIKATGKKKSTYAVLPGPVSANKHELPVNEPAVRDSLLPVTDSSGLNEIAIQPVKSVPVVFPLLKKKLPVVHINELEKSLPQIEAVAGNTERPRLRQRIFNRQAIPETDLSSGDGNLLRIKLSPQN